MNTPLIEPKQEAATRPWVIGLVGGVGSGKSTLAKWVAQHHPVRVIHADQLGHAALLEPAVKQRLRDKFGDDIFDAGGEISRARLATLVFGDEQEAQERRRALEEIVHPVIRRGLQEAITAADRAGVSGILVDAPVLLEAGWSDICDGTVFIESAFDDRARRVAETRGWSVEELIRRESSQWSVERKQAATSITVRNAGSVEEGGIALWEGIRRYLGCCRA